MAGKYQKYPEYKDSEIQWLGDIPEHWKVSRLRWYIKICSGEGLTNSKFETDKSKTNKYPVIGGNGILGYTEYQNTISKTIVVGRVGALCGNVHFFNTNCWITDNALKINSWFFFQDDYLKYILISSKLNELANKNAQPLITGEQVKSLYICLPALNEQTQIANFLDHETAKIDTLIEKQQALIKLLKEKRQAVISHAVTKGLDPDVPMKDSGVEWLGEVPEHWEVKKLRYLGNARNGLTYSPNDVVDKHEGVLVLRSSNIQNGKLEFNDNVYVNVKIPNRMITKKNDILICSRNGSRALIGKNALISKEAAGYAYGAFMMIFRSEYNTYLYWIFNSPLFIYQSGSFLTSTINQLTVGNLNGFEIPLPPLNEQNDIIKYLDKTIRQSDTSISLVYKQINLLQERRTALISAAVTGKIDVRDWQAPEE